MQFSEWSLGRRFYRRQHVESGPMCCHSEGYFVAPPWARATERGRPSGTPSRCGPSAPSSAPSAVRAPMSSAPWPGGCFPPSLPFNYNDLRICVLVCPPPKSPSLSPPSSVKNEGNKKKEFRYFASQTAEIPRTPVSPFVATAWSQRRMWGTRRVAPASRGLSRR